jgi:Fic family protein
MRATALPSTRVPDEMQRFIAWFNATAPDEENALPALTRAAHSHLYFECIHPFEDGNGRIGRAISEKALAQSLGQPTLIALAYTIERRRKDYYAALERSTKDLNISGWMIYFANTILEAQATTIKRVDFYVAKAQVLPAVPRHPQRTSSQSGCPHVPGRHRRFRGRP